MPNSKLIRHHYPKLGDAVGPYVHAVEHNQTLYTSGFTAFGSAAQTENIGLQLKDIFRQLSIIAEQHQSSLDSLIKVTIFITDLKDLPLARETLTDIYGGQLPASSLVLVAGLFHPDLNVEVEATIAI
ncbi:enamine deaminase RidA [Vibrio sp. vnigr-6D03]|uniref:RidA family protein n=1 Tax=Vibrio sp. vnigr-6D03 TaxID=2058088 RepID=UPI000C321FEE|nr:RidA family protein [Vibrio sp. vnigr-6D03]PKF80116.1 enamine deaminase RidA [Vibrio sp. vnigr-6D03]